MERQKLPGLARADGVKAETSIPVPYYVKILYERAALLRFSPGQGRILN